MQVKVCLRGVCAVLFLFLIMSMPARAATQQLCIQLKWLHQSQFAGFYMAAREGFYRQEGIQVHFIEGGPEIDLVKRMADPSCPIGIASAQDIVIARDKGIPVIAVAAINQVSPIVFFSLRTSGIRSPRQFEGKSIALLKNAALQYYGMLDRVGVDPSTMRKEPFSLNMTRLYEGEVEIWSGYHTNLVSRAEEQGYRLNIIHPLDYGIQVYDDVIYVRHDLVRDDPELVLGFLRATFKGWEQSIKYPSKAVEHTLKYAVNTGKRHESILLRRTIPYVHTGEVPIGWMTPEVWADIVRLCSDTGVVSGEIKPGTVFTTRFLREIYDMKDRR